jgi:saccharopine dehydrogenase-like NADP-dependent oxidoreductase
MVVYGDQKHSAMAKTVGLPAAIATRMLLERMSNFQTFNKLNFIHCFV